MWRDVYGYIYIRWNEFVVVGLKTCQIALNGLLFISLRSDQKIKSQNTLQQYGLTTQKQLQQAQQISSSLQNHNLGTYYPEFVRAFITLYLFGLIIHLIHTQIRLIYLKQSKFSQLMSTLLMVFFQILDLMIVNDFIILNSEFSNLSQAVSDIYVDNGRKSKDILQLFEAVIRQLININRCLSFFFQGQVLWLEGLRPLIKNRKKVTISTPPLQKQQKQLSPPQIPNIPKQQQQQQKKSKLITLSPEKSKKSSKKKANSNKAPLSSTKHETLKEDSVPPLQLSKQESYFRDSTTKADSNQSQSQNSNQRRNRSESLPQRLQQQFTNLIRYPSQDHKKQPKQQRNQNEHIFKFNLETNVDKYEFKCNTIAEVNNHLTRIAQENYWNSFLSLNVRLNFWHEAYKTSQSLEIKEELKRTISQYALYLMNSHTQNQEIIE